MIEAADVLLALGACGESIEWLRERSRAVAPERRTAEAAWLDCERGDWLTWLITRPAIRDAAGDRALRLIACDCAERVLPLYESRRPGDDRPRRAIEVARRYAEGLASAEELREARCTAAAYAAADAAYAAYAAYADAAYAAYAAADAAYAAADDAHKAERAAQAEIVRRHVPWPIVRDALAGWWVTR
jgi:hypothetical protein